MLKKLRLYFTLTVLSLGLALPVLAASVSDTQSLRQDLAFAFGENNTKLDNSSPSLLTEQEMTDTEGEWVHLRYVPRAWGYVKTFRVRGHYDAKPHRFSNNWGPLRGNRPHYQLTFYRKGVSGSHWNARIPWGSRTTWGSHKR